MGQINATEPVSYMSAGNEVETLLSTLDRIRSTFGWKCSGLDAAGMTARLGPSTVTLGSLVKHLALVEDMYFTSLLAGDDMPGVWHDYDGDGWEWRSAADDTPDDLLSLWRDAVTRSRAATAEALARDGLDTLTRRPRHEEILNLRRIVADLIEEYARHTGHADLIRESVDGLVGEDPPQEWPL
jgi:hypothetical protein